MSTLLLTGWCGPEFAGIARHTLPLMERYAQKHGMDYKCVNLHADDAPPSWVKVPRIISALKSRHRDTVVWLDADVVVFRSDVNILDDFDASKWQGLVEHETESGLVPNCGVWVVTKEMLSTLEQIWMDRSRFLHHWWWEQAAVLDKMGYRLASGAPIASRGEPTILFDRTEFLPARWNHHPKDARRDANAHFVHVTQYVYREAACREFAAHAT
jgi:hypothetical protein